MAGRSKYVVTKTIITEDLNLAGLIIKGKAKDLVGGFSEEETEVPKSISELMAFNSGAGFRNYQITVTKNGFNELGNFKLNSLKMLLFRKASNDYVEISNGVSVTARLVNGNETVGFKVKFDDGSEANLSYNNVVAMSRWFRPRNFSVRTRSKTETTEKKSYISGNGISLADLPAITVVGAETDAKSRGKAVQQAKRNDNILKSGFDILDVYEIINKYHGQVIKLPGEKYVPASYTSTEEGKFVPLGIGEVASPKLSFNATKLNVNAGFKKVGYVPVSINGANANITTFTYATKSLFIAGENYIKTFGIAVPSENEEQLIKELGNSLALEKITDNTIIQPLSSVIDASSLVFYKVTSNNLELIADSKLKSAILSTSQIVELQKEISAYKIMTKALGTYGILGDVKEDYGETALNSALYNKKVAGNMALYSSEILSKLQAMGFNIYTGAYTERTAKTEKSGTGTGTTPIEITYTVEGWDPSKFSAKLVKEYVTSGKSGELPLTISMVNVLKALYTNTSPKETVVNAKNTLDKCEAKLNELNKKMWMHNAAQFILGGKSAVHTSDAGEWQFIKSLKTGDVYRNKKMPELSVKVSGVTIPV